MKKDLSEFMAGVDDGPFRAKKEAEHLEIVYREAFKGEIGEEALTRILADMCFLKPLKTQEDVHLYNCSLQLLRDMGILKSEKYPQIIEALISVRGGK